MAPATKTCDSLGKKEGEDGDMEDLLEGKERPVAVLLYYVLRKAYKNVLENKTSLQAITINTSYPSSGSDKVYAN